MKKRFETELREARERNDLRLAGSTPEHMRKVIEFKRNGLKSTRAKCEICGEVVSGRALAIDHCHDSGEIRGYLCMTCNAGLGMFKDSLFLLGNATKYLTKHAWLKKRRS